jgi:hypothetical protein
MWESVKMRRLSLFPISIPDEWLLACRQSAQELPGASGATDEMQHGMRKRRKESLVC